MHANWGSTIKFKCEYCEEEFSTPFARNTHKESVHPDRVLEDSLVEVRENENISEQKHAGDANNGSESSDYFIDEPPVLQKKKKRGGRRRKK